MGLIEKVLSVLDQKEIDYRLESNHCSGYIFSFLDGYKYPRRWIDSGLDNDIGVIAESVDNMIEKAINNSIEKDWNHRIYGDSLNETFKQVDKYLNENYS